MVIDVVDETTYVLAIDRAAGTHLASAADLEPTGITFERADVEKLLASTAWEVERCPHDQDTLDNRAGTRATVAEISRALDHLLETLESEDLGQPWIGTRRISSWQIAIDADRWGLLVLAREALRLAAADSRDAHFDTATYLEEFEDVFSLQRADTPPRWWRNNPNDAA